MTIQVGSNTVSFTLIDPKVWPRPNPYMRESVTPDVTDAMIQGQNQEAVRCGQRIGIIASAPATLRDGDY